MDELREKIAEIIGFEKYGELYNDYPHMQRKMRIVAEGILAKTKPIIEKPLLLRIAEMVSPDEARSADEQVKREERERIIAVIESYNSIGYPYGADFKVAILQALKKRRQVND